MRWVNVLNVDYFSGGSCCVHIHFISKQTKINVATHLKDKNDKYVRRLIRLKHTRHWDSGTIIYGFCPFISLLFCSFFLYSLPQIESPCVNVLLAINFPLLSHRCCTERIQMLAFVYLLCTNSYAHNW